jgi:hypothetical protein
MTETPTPTPSPTDYYPQLNSGKVEPEEGIYGWHPQVYGLWFTTHEYSVYYADPDGGEPNKLGVYVNDDYKEMSLKSGDYWNGIYHYPISSDKLELYANNNFYFQCEDDENNHMCLPMEGSHDGPYIHPPPTVEFSQTPTPTKTIIYTTTYMPTAMLMPTIEPRIVFDMHVEPDTDRFETGDSFTLLLDVSTPYRELNVDIYWVMLKYSTGDMYCAPNWTTDITPLFENIPLPVYQDVNDLVLLDAVIPFDKPPVNERGKYLFAIGAAHSGTYLWASNIATVDFSYYVDEQPYAGEVRVFDGIEFVYVPAGSFMMGSDIGTRDERPVHEVTISKGFWLSRYEITQTQWRDVMDDNPSLSLSSKKPVENVSYNDVQAYISALGNAKYRLPTEAEWEYACRANSTTIYSFGNDITHLEDHAWFGEISSGLWDRSISSHSVGEKKPNKWGLYDMHGNVYEWCQDWYGRNYYSESPVNVDPTGPSSGEERVVRGGSFCYYPSSLRSSDRFKMAPDEKSFHVGFRLLREE